MKPHFRRTRIASGVAAVAAAASVLAAPGVAHADTPPFTPSPSDFTNCPALPAGAIKLFWNCLSITLNSGTVVIGKISQSPGPIQIDVAVGFVDGKLTTITGPFGGSGAMAAAAKVKPTGRVQTRGLTSFSTQIQEAGPIQMNGLLPSAIPVKVKVINPLLGGNCYIGSDSNPIVIHPVISNVGLKFPGGQPVVNATVSDSTFSVPGAKGCGLGLGLMDDIVNAIAGLPSPSGKNSASFDTYVQVKNYALGNITAKAAAAMK